MINEENSHWFWALGIAALAIAAGVGFYYFAWRQPAVPVPAAPAPVVEAPARVEPPPIQHPIEDAPAQPPAEPAKPVTLADSDAAVLDAINRSPGTKRLAELLNPRGAFIRRFVATVDNLPRAKVSSQVLAVQPVGGKFAVNSTSDALLISADNPTRYTPFVRIAESIDVKAAAAIYVRYYALFQEAYRELGYPKGYFNDRLVEVIDHLLATPEVAGPIKVVQPKVLYEFADPELEALSAGQKALIRMGTDNAIRIKAKLREVRREVTRRAPKG